MWVWESIFSTANLNNPANIGVFLLALSFWHLAAVEFAFAVPTKEDTANFTLCYELQTGIMCINRFREYAAARPFLKG